MLYTHCVIMLKAPVETFNVNQNFVNLEIKWKTKKYCTILSEKKEEQSFNKTLARRHQVVIYEIINWQWNIKKYIKTTKC